MKIIILLKIYRMKSNEYQKKKYKNKSWHANCYYFNGTRETPPTADRVPLIQSAGGATQPAAFPLGLPRRLASCGGMDGALGFQHASSTEWK